MDSQSKIVIRPRRDDDLDELVQTLLAVHAQDGYPVEGVADPQAWLQLPSPASSWVAELDGHVVGHVALTEPQSGDVAPDLWSRVTGRPPDRSVVMSRLFVNPRARGHGIGERLALAALHEAEELGRAPVLDVMLKDHSAIHMYEGLGMTSLGNFSHIHSGGNREKARAYTFADARSSSATGDNKPTARPDSRLEGM